MSTEPSDLRSSSELAAPSERRPLRGPFAWRGSELEASREWVRPFSPPEIEEIEAALRDVRRRGLSLPSVTREDFPLPRLAAGLAAVGEELERGRGFVLLRGVPVERYTLDELRLIFWGIGAHLGTAVSQSKQGELMGEVKDVGVRLGQPTSRGYRSNEHLRFHTDRCDVVALLCVRKAKSGGLSRVVSSVAIHNEMLARRPDLLEQLFRDYWHSRQGEEVAGEDPWYVQPVFAVEDGRFTSQYSRSYIESAQRMPTVPRLAAAQDAALDLLAELAEELCMHMELEPGDIQLLNNHVTYHSRTGYEDHADPAKQRLLLRLWLSVPGSRRLPRGYETLWGRIEAGALRGGVTAGEGYRNVEEYRRLRAPR